MLQQSRTYAELCYITMIMTIVFYLDKYWYCKLTPNHKALVYYECSENDDILPDQQEKKREDLHYFSYLFICKSSCLKLFEHIFEASYATCTNVSGPLVTLTNN